VGRVFGGAPMMVIKLDPDTEVVLQHLYRRGTVVLILKKQIFGQWRQFPSREVSLGLLVSELGITPEHIADSLLQEHLEDQDNIKIPLEWKELV
jgi:hypothetical protein